MGNRADATASTGFAFGTWTLTVRIDDVLKGHGRAGDTGRFFLSSCGPAMTPEMAEEAASRFIGDQRLFIGTYGRGALNPISDHFKPQVSPRQQYRLALQDLGFPQRESVPPLGPFVSGGLPRWLWWLVAAAVLLVVLGVYLSVRRHRATSTP